MRLLRFDMNITLHDIRTSARCNFDTTHDEGLCWVTTVGLTPDVQPLYGSVDAKRLKGSQACLVRRARDKDEGRRG